MAYAPPTPPTYTPPPPAVNYTAPIAPSPAVPPEYSAAAQDVFLDDAAKKGGFNKWIIGGGIAALLLMAGVYYALFLSDDVGRNKGGTPLATPTAPVVAAEAEATVFYAVSQANIRDAATAQNSNVIGKLQRGQSMPGKRIKGTDGISDWIEFSDGKGFMSATYLIETAPPKLVKILGDRQWTADKPVTVWQSPDSSSTVLDQVGKGTVLTLVGLTENDFIEIKLKKGGVGYISEGTRIATQEVKPAITPIAIALRPETCSFGSALEAQFNQMNKKAGAKREAIMNGNYPTPDAKQAALEAYDGASEGRSVFADFKREYKGLTVTGIAQHYESQSIYFADPPEKVIEVFRSQGFGIDASGNFKNDELYTSIGKASRANSKSELSCGV
jgi:hypothetical protein